MGETKEIGVDVSVLKECIEDYNNLDLGEKISVSQTSPTYVLRDKFMLAVSSVPEDVEEDINNDSTKADVWNRIAKTYNQMRSYLAAQKQTQKEEVKVMKKVEKVTKETKAVATKGSSKGGNSSAVAEKKIETKKAPSVATKEPKSAKPAANEKLVFLSGLISKGKLTRKEVVEQAVLKFPDASPAGLATLVSDGKNPKYNKFPKLVVENDKGLISFAK